jgi:predicted CXXCH cytochrome family protein
MLMAAGVMVGCDAGTRQWLRANFFDGVPGLGGEEPNATAGRMKREQSARAAQQATEESMWVIHPPVSSCSNCHISGSQSGLPEFIKPLPQLCYNCHADYALQGACVHGPVAVGDCLLCHESHKSKFKGLLKVAQPELCYQCHEKESLLAGGAHQQKPMERCTECHESHAASTQMLLKP